MRFLSALALASFAAPALADDAMMKDGGALTYEMFETAIQHVNLAECPAALAGEGRFCRVTMHNDAFHVFAFTEDGEQPMVGLRSYYEDEIDIDFGMGS